MYSTSHPSFSQELLPVWKKTAAGMTRHGLWLLVAAKTTWIATTNLSVALSFSLLSRWLAPSRWNRLTARVGEVVVFFSSSCFISFFPALSRLSLFVLPLCSHLFQSSKCFFFSAGTFLFLVPILSYSYVFALMFIIKDIFFIIDRLNGVWVYVKHILEHTRRFDNILIRVHIYNLTLAFFICYWFKSSWFVD